MDGTLPESVRQLLLDKAYGHVITLGKDGKPQVTMVWMDVNGNTPSFNTSEGRVKLRNLRRDPRVIVAIQNREHPQSYLLLEGTATITTDGADDQIDKLANRFLGQERYHFRQPGERRVTVNIDVTKIDGVAPGFKRWN